MKSEKSRFLDKCYDRLYSGDLTVFEECFTPDYTLCIPETQLMTNAGYLKGEFAAEFLSHIIQGDAKNFDRTIETVREVEQGDTVVREILYTMKMNPNKPGDMLDANYPPDMKIVIRLMTLYQFRDGKICEEFTTYNLLATELDFAQGDLKKAVAKILKMEPMMKEAKAKLAKGELPFPPNPS
ncbi:MAG: hypothetical protein A2Z77_00445 [Chloroflexi bacterium RBG_13_51_36]|nr:MAG: hypothetical protein A2Z77_00445 [Chloroflexi bacterium RBG_13_51_36]